MKTKNVHRIDTDQFSARNNGHQWEALGNKYGVCGTYYFPEPSAKVYCVKGFGWG